jgi:AcrR family transcriptional regulator
MLTDVRPERQPRRDAQANQERVLAAAMAAVLREGARVRMSTVAADAGVGIGTVYRHYPTRELLLDAVTRRSFETVLASARAAESASGPASTGLDQFLGAVIARHGDLVLPLHGGPDVASTKTRAVRAEVHRTIDALVARGRADGSIRADATTREVIVFGAMLAQPLPNTSDWPTIAGRLKSVYLDGLRPRA